MSTQLLPHIVLDVHWHFDWMHEAPAGHWLLQLPQFDGSEVRLVQPLLHAVSPAAQVQAPPEQIWPLLQACPQLPQFCVSFSRSVHVPLHDGKLLAQRQEPCRQIWR